MNQQDAIKRWDDFLRKMYERANELIAPAREQGLNLFIESGNDFIPVINALNGINRQLIELCAKADNTWEEKVRDLMYNSGLKDNSLDRQEDKRDQFRTSTEVDFAWMEVEVRNQIAEHVLKLAQQDKAKTSSCTQCLAPLEIPPHTYKSEHITCRFCQTVNTYEPGTYQRMVGGCLQDIAHWKVREDMKNEIQTRNLIHRQRDQGFEKAKSVHKEAFQTYWKNYLTELKALNPTTDMEKEMVRQMKTLDY